MLDVNNAVSNFIKQLVNKEKQKIVSVQKIVGAFIKISDLK
jgi:hypothetical protein